MELDGLCRRLVKEAPAYLNEGGYMEMLCEWAQIKGQPWEERIAEWLEGTGCDAWVMKGLTQDPEEYAQHRIRETSQDTTDDAKNYAGYMNYYRHRGVEAIHDGLVVMRKRQGPNWVRIEEVPSTPSGNLGDMILATFAAHDLLLANNSDEKLLAIHPQLAPPGAPGADLPPERRPMARGVADPAPHQRLPVPSRSATAGCRVPGGMRRHPDGAGGHSGVCGQRQRAAGRCSERVPRHAAQAD